VIEPKASISVILASSIINATNIIDGDYTVTISKISDSVFNNA
jgi:hypothetical protein